MAVADPVRTQADGSTELEPADLGYPRTVEHAQGELTLAHRPRRIVSLHLAADEILLDMVEPWRIAALTYLADDERNSNVRDRAHLVPAKIRAQVEEVAALQPDLVLAATFNNQKDVTELRRRGVPVLTVPFPETVEDMKRSLRLIGRAVGQEAVAEALVHDMELRLKDVAKVVDAVPEGERPRVLYLAHDYYSVGPGRTFGDVIRLAGGTNALTDDPSVGGKQITREEAAANPDVIVFSDVHPGEEGWADELKSDPLISQTPAAKSGRIHWLPDSGINSTSHYIVQGVEQAARVFYPGRFDAQDKARARFSETAKPGNDVERLIVDMFALPNTVFTITSGDGLSIAELMGQNQPYFGYGWYKVETKGFHIHAKVDAVKTIRFVRAPSDHYAGQESLAVFLKGPAGESLLHCYFTNLYGGGQPVRARFDEWATLKQKYGRGKDEVAVDKGNVVG